MAQQGTAQQGAALSGTPDDIQDFFERRAALFARRSASSGSGSDATSSAGTSNVTDASKSYPLQQQQQQEQRLQPQLRRKLAGEPYLVCSRKWYVLPPPRNEHVGNLPSRTWHPDTLKQFWLQPSNRALYAQVLHAMMPESGIAVDAYRAMREFIGMCRAATNGGRTECTLFSDTSGFDFSWLSFYLSHYGPADCASPSYLFGEYRPVSDVSSFFAGFALSMPGDRSRKARYPHLEAMRRLGLAESDWLAYAEREHVPPYDHDPEHDATHVGLRSAWIMWSMARLRSQDWQIAMIVRTDLRMSKTRIISQCANAAVGAYVRASDDDARQWQASGSCKHVLKCADAQTLFAIRDHATKVGLNHFMQFDNSTKVLTVLAVGPADAEILNSVVGVLKQLQ